MIRRKGPDQLWVILAGDTPTSFRARSKDVLLPTLYQLQRTQPDVSLKWFERGRLWSSPLEAREALVASRGRRRTTTRPADWRPGGSHKDPKQRFELTRDQKRARFKARQRSPAASARASSPPGKPRKGPR
jgi:hypothetical protein